MGLIVRYAVTEPGSPMAHAQGCTCPADQPALDDPRVYARADDCPVHRFEHAWADRPDGDVWLGRARSVEAVRAVEREAARG